MLTLINFQSFTTKKKLLARTTPLMYNVHCTFLLSLFFRTAAVTTTLVAKVSKTSPTSGNKSHTVKEEEMEENDGKSKGSMKKVAWLILIVIGIVAIFTGVGVKIFLVIRVVIGGVHHKEHVSFK